ncbi:MAG: alpha-(1-2)-phosphatidylinositol mannosyltransferase [Actinobacteria bacterium]|nr:alpha-(1-2)-phosphatidylinositol mannosyltransferase [Actinomycetota bacterium]
MRHLLVTNDYPPKVGGIQSYLWEIYRRLPQDKVVVYTTPHPDSELFDQKQTHKIIRSKQRVLLPGRQVANQIRSVAEVENIDFIMYDPAVPIGVLGRKIGIPYGVILHGAEVTIPGRVPIARTLIANVLQHAKLVVTAGDYSTKEATRAAKRNLPVSVIPPGVDVNRFKPLDEQTRSTARGRFNFRDDDEVILSLSRLVPRKGMDVLISATSELAKTRPKVHLLIAGTGRDLRRLKALAESTNAPVTFLGYVSDDEVSELYGIADVFGMICRVRWGGLEQEGFGIVFLEAAACGVPQIAGRSGGADEAVLEGETGFVVDSPTDSNAVKQALEKLLADSETRKEMGKNSRARAEKEFSYDHLAIKYWEALLSQQQ